MDIPEVEKTQAALETTATKFADDPRNISLLLWIAAILFVGAVAAFPLAKWLAIPLAIIGLAVFAFAVNKKRKATQVDSSKLKGASPFGIKEGELFSGLGRDGVVKDLYNHVVQRGVAVILIFGPSGAGKTSVINAGLRKALEDDKKEEQRKFVYVDAAHGDFERSLLLECNDHSDTEKTTFETLEALIASDDPREQVIVVDSAELADNEQRLMDWARLALAKAPLYRKVLVLVLDQEAYDKSWSKEDFPRSRSLRRVPIERFKTKVAKVVARALSDKARVRISDRLIDEIVAGVAMDDPDSVVSPLSLSVLLQRVGNAGNSRFGIRDYRAAGYAAGMMGTYIREQLTSLTGEYSQAVLAALARQAPLLSPFGAKTLEIAPSYLKSLSSPDVHILRANQTETLFQILEDWLPALRGSWGSPNPEITFLENHISKKYKWWRESQAFSGRGIVRILREGRYLLTRHELMEVEENQSTTRIGDDQDNIVRYISRSRRYRTTQLVAASLFAFSLLPASIFAYASVQRWQAQKLEEGWGLPKNFPKYGDQLRELSVVCMVNDLQWLPRNLTSLEANCGRITSLKGVPPHLRHLGLSLSKVETLDYLPKSVTELDIHGTAIRAIDGLGGFNLRVLDASGIAVPNMYLVPRSVTNLALQHPSIESLEGLPENLTDLVILGTGVKSLRNLPNSVRRLTVVQNGNLVIDSLPAHLERLETTTSLPKKNALPSSVTTLILSSLGPVEVPGSIVNLELRKSQIFGPLPKGLDSLKLADAESSLPLDKIPTTLHHLKIQWPNGTGFGSLPKDLVELDVSRSQALTSLAGLGPVRDLNISMTGIQNLREVPKSVETLRFEVCGAVSLTTFPPSLKYLDLGECSSLDLIENIPGGLEVLDVHGTALSKLPALPDSLTTLDISNTKIRGHLPRLPLRLKELILHTGQIDTLEGLPNSVRIMRFRRQPESNN
jgi:hypothetical protein